MNDYLLTVTQQWEGEGYYKLSDGYDYTIKWYDDEYSLNADFESMWHSATETNLPTVEYYLDYKAEHYRGVEED